MFLGPINVRATRKDVQLKVKEEYNSYRVLLSTYLLICLSISMVPLPSPFDGFICTLEYCLVLAI